MTDGHWDPGLQPERTASAWTRTTLALAVVALLATRSRLGPEGLVLGFGAMLAMAGLTLACAVRLPRLNRSLHAGRMRPAFGLVGTMTALACAIPLIALVFQLTP